MKIESRKRYKSGRGTIESIHSETKAFPEFMWSLGGNWYSKESGRFVDYVKEYDENGRCIGGHYKPNASPTAWDLVEEFTDYDYDEYWRFITK